MSRTRTLSVCWRTLTNVCSPKWLKGQMLGGKRFRVACQWGLKTGFEGAPPLGSSLALPSVDLSAPAPVGPLGASGM